MTDARTAAPAAPSAAPAAPMLELTLRGVILGALITFVFTAANVYLGLKVGITFATSIPAAVISMAILRFFASATILENNIVQTIASAAGTLAAIIFVLPGLLMVGWWQGFPYWTTAAVCALGGILGVMFSIPLRRALVTGGELPFPEGIAAAEVLKVGAESRAGGEENARGLKVIVFGSLISAGYALLAATRLVAGEVAHFFKLPAISATSASGVTASLSMALIGVGHLVGLTVGIAMTTGMLIGWAVLLPILTAAQPAIDPVADVVNTVFRSQVRFIGAGAIAVAAIWTLLKIIGPIVGGVTSAIAASRARGAGETLDLTERDLPIGIVGTIVALSMLPIAWLLWDFSAGGPVRDHAALVIGGTLVYILVIGVVIAAVCGYMAGLLGASNSPVSGVGILAAITAALLLALVFGRGVDAQGTAALVAYALFATAIVFSVATISNDNLQDLKTGQLVGATPWRQQVALVLGVVFGSLVIPPVLNLLATTLGFQGMAGAGPNALAAPQAALISSLAKGVLGGDIDWSLIGLGAAIGVGVIVVDEVLSRTTRYRLPPLGVGMGIYLPMAITLLVPIGAVIGHLYNRMAARSRRPELVERMGVLAATGLIVGESLFGVAFAGIVAASGSDAPLALVAEPNEALAAAAGIAVFFGTIAWLYRRTTALATRE